MLTLPFFSLSLLCGSEYKKRGFGDYRGVALLFCSLQLLPSELVVSTERERENKKRLLICVLMCGCLTIMQLFSSLNGSDGKTQKETSLFDEKKKLQGLFGSAVCICPLKKNQRKTGRRVRLRGRNEKEGGD